MDSFLIIILRESEDKIYLKKIYQSKSRNSYYTVFVTLYGASQVAQW